MVADERWLRVMPLRSTMTVILCRDTGRPSCSVAAAEAAAIARSCRSWYHATHFRNALGPIAAPSPARSSAPMRSTSTG